MSRLRKSVINSIYSTLNNSSFTADDFCLEFPDHGEKLVVISFVPAPKYQLTILEKQESSNFSYSTSESPGTYKITDVYPRSSIAECLDAVHKWCEKIQEDLQSNIRVVTLKDIDDLRESINDVYTDKIDKLTSTEIIEINKRLDNFRNEFEELYTKAKLDDSKLRKVRDDIKTISQNLSLFSKSIWYHTAANKILQLIAQINDAVDRKKAIDAAKAIFSKVTGGI
jgi:hypothetical protein